MFFCTNCDNIYDITKIKQDIKADTDTETDTDNIINKVLEKKQLSEVEMLLLPQLTNSPEFKKLSNSDKKKVKENMNDITVPVELKAFFVCKNCGNHETIAPGTQIIHKNYNSNTGGTGEKDYTNMVNVPYIPRTREFVCPNKSCKSHADHSKREAVFFRINNSYKVKYVCCECKTSW